MLVFFKNDFLNYRYSWGHLEQFVKAIAWKIEKTLAMSNRVVGEFNDVFCFLLSPLFLGKSRIEDSRYFDYVHVLFTHFGGTGMWVEVGERLFTVGMNSMVELYWLLSNKIW